MKAQKSSYQDSPYRKNHPKTRRNRETEETLNDTIAYGKYNYSQSNGKAQSKVIIKKDISQHNKNVKEGLNQSYIRSKPKHNYQQNSFVKHSDKYSKDDRLRHMNNTAGILHLASQTLHKKKQEKINIPHKKSIERFEKHKKAESDINSEQGFRNRNPDSSHSKSLHFSKSESFDKNNEIEAELIWGRHPSQAVLESERPLHRVWCTSELKSSGKFLQLLKKVKASNVLVEEVTWARLTQLTGGGVHQGIALQIAAVETLDLVQLIEACYKLEERPLLIAVEGLTDPQNLGAIIRSAEALGAHGLILPQRRNAGLTGSVAKVAAGALEYLPVARVVNLNRSLDTLKEKGYRIIGLAEEGDVSLIEADLTGPLVVVTGSEGNGLSLLTRRHCDQLVRIPLRGFTPSLNAAVASALMLYEIARRSWMKGLDGQSPAPRIVRPRIKPSSISQIAKLKSLNDEATVSLEKAVEFQKFLEKSEQKSYELINTRENYIKPQVLTTQSIAIESKKQMYDVMYGLPCQAGSSIDL
uniref:tRNA/rRNA methyltransferase (SpoU):RNA methyltransferase TrmH n=1 Tax=Paulinella longichromatophora TaxID=1708747 RepID=A0A2H4ZNJ3_9EUKA|nr:tRNA/rRNA methyltransferase (SpoU):RNA methyltransferase TrmH [Paulinella longichromatophora]